jgi:tetratricopeptide (TPR) repeat protein
MEFLRYDEKLDKYNMLGRLQVSVAIGVVVIVGYSFQFIRFTGFLKVFGVGLLAAGGFLLIGFLLGFIFGIPRIAAARSEAGASSTSVENGTSQVSVESDNSKTISAAAAVETNSNLIEISDWLTKILVGVSLVELNKIPGRLKELTEYLGRGLRDCNDSTGGCPASYVQSSEAFAFGIIIFFFAAGFLIGYLWTRLYLQPALTELAGRADRVDRSWEYTYLAEILLRDGALGQAIALIDNALRVNPKNSSALLTKGRILKRLAQAEGKPGNQQLLEQALAFASRSAALKPNVPGTIYNVACYQALLGKDKAEILKNLRTAFQLSGKLKQAARTDPDLQSLWEDEDFKRLTT